MGARQMKTKCVVVMPPIYRFLWKEEHRQDMKKWGWHKASELLVAINGIFIANGVDNVDAAKFVAEHPRLVPFTGGCIGPWYAFPGECLMVTKEGETEIVYPVLDKTITAEGDWLSPLARSGYFIPAAVGMKLIEAAKKSSVGWFQRLME
jgi:hypothetical protein